MAVRGHQDVQLSLALLLNILRHRRHILATDVLRRGGAAVINQHVPVLLRVMEGHEEAIAESHVVHPDGEGSWARHGFSPPLLARWKASGTTPSAAAGEAARRPSSSTPPGHTHHAPKGRPAAASVSPEESSVP